MKVINIDLSNLKKRINEIPIDEKDEYCFLMSRQTEGMIRYFNDVLMGAAPPRFCAIDTDSWFLGFPIIFVSTIPIGEVKVIKKVEWED